MKLIDGRHIGQAIRREVAASAASLRAGGIVPTLAVVVPTDDEAAAWYVRSIERAGSTCGIDVRVDFLRSWERKDIVHALDGLSADPSVHGIICQTPLPEAIRLEDVARHIAPAKDVDGANPVSLGALMAGLPHFAPATATAVMEILRHERIPLAGRLAVVVGRSTVVGKPVALQLLNENATVMVCHSRTGDLASVCAQADVLVVAVGRARLIGASHIKPGAVVIDVGTNPDENGILVGDVDAESVTDRAGALTPVPGGVGPVTTSVLLRQTVQAATLSR